MQVTGLRGARGARRGKAVRTTVRNPALPCPLERVNRQRHAPSPDRLWVGGFTRVATWPGFACVAFVIDACARRIVGRRVSRTARAGFAGADLRFVLDALEQAIPSASPPRGPG